MRFTHQRKLDCLKMKTNNLTPEQRITRAHIQIMGEPALQQFSALLLVGKTYVSYDVPRATTNGLATWYNPDFLDTLEDDKVIGLILHENLHKAYQHCWLWNHLLEEDAELWGQAIDHVVNLEILELRSGSSGCALKFDLPEGGCYDPRFQGMTTEQIFRELQKDKEAGAPGGTGFDDHYPQELSDEQRRAVQDQITEALRQGQFLASRNGGNRSRTFDTLLAPSVNWREELRDFALEVCVGQDDCTWKRPNRRFLGQDIYLPSKVSESIDCIVVGIDTSGSIDDKILTQFISELIGICEAVNPQTLHLIECDATIQAHEVYTQETWQNIATKSEVKGGGGTDMPLILDYVQEHNLQPAAVIILTDGLTPWPSTINQPTLWAITTHIVAPIGVTIHIK